MCGGDGCGDLLRCLSTNGMAGERFPVKVRGRGDADGWDLE